jgi:hypothetical protein
MNEFNEESVRSRIRSLLEELQTEADPQLLDRFRSIFRQEVSFFRRSYMAAYLLLLAEKGNGRPRQFGSRDRQRNDRQERNERPDRNERTDRERADRNERPERAERFERREENPLSEEESVKLFISVGRNRKIFPRDIFGLIASKADVAREDIGLMRILDNYSFIQVRNTAADKIIQALNGQNFRGRTLTVNFARSRNEAGDSAADADNAADADVTVGAGAEAAAEPFSSDDT